MLQEITQSELLFPLYMTAASLFINNAATISLFCLFVKASIYFYQNPVQLWYEFENRSIIDWEIKYILTLHHLLYCSSFSCHVLLSSLCSHFSSIILP